MKPFLTSIVAPKIAVTLPGPSGEDIVRVVDCPYGVRRKLSRVERNRRKRMRRARR